MISAWLSKIVAGFVCAAMLWGCSSGPKNFLNENDRLREENMKLQEQVEQLQKNLELRIGEVKALRKQEERAGEEDAEVAEPVFSKIEIGKFSGAVDVDGDGKDDLIRIYLETLDQQGRMLPVAAKAVVRVVRIGDEDEQPELVLEEEYSVEEFDASYRSNLTGKHYTLEVELPGMEEEVEELTVKVSVMQVTTGVKFAEQKAFEVTR